MATVTRAGLRMAVNIVLTRTHILTVTRSGLTHILKGTDMSGITHILTVTRAGLRMAVNLVLIRTHILTGTDMSGITHTSSQAQI